MDMTAGLGIAVGTANSDAAVTRAGDVGEDGTASVIASRSTIVQLSPDGTATLGSSGTGRAGLTGFVERVADPVGLLGPDGRAHSGEDLFAAAVTCLVDEVRADTESAPDERTPIVVTHPTPWNGHTVRALESALERIGLPPVILASEATACLRWLESARGPQDDGVVVVYDLGAASLDVSVMRTGAEAGLLGRTLRSEDVTGAQFDHLVTRHVLDDLTGRTPGFDPFDPAVLEALTMLRRNCSAAKEALSTDTEAVIPVALPDLETDVRLVRSELEDLVRAPLTTSLDLIREALRSADVEPGDVHHVLLTGGGGAIPLLAELVSSELGMTVVAAPNPAHTAALGAALLAADAEAHVAAPAVPTAPAGITRGSDSTEPLTPVFPSRLHSTRSGTNVRRRIAIIAASAAAIGVLAAGGLSLGTAADPAPEQSTPPASAVPLAENAATGAGPTGEGSPTGTVTVAGSTGGNSTNPATVAARGGSTATGVDPTGRALPQGVASPAPFSEAAPAPTADNPAPGETPTQPVYTPPPAAGGGTAPAPVQGPSPAQIGTGFGNAAEGVGNGVGAVLNGVGGVVGGVVGAVVDPVTGLLIGK
ncbi:Hsp70 family protein [Rhodococcus hoagii]|uniref:Hsp70 family protein n=2 Tax=Rhodococcus hoagii TaxID=43767 RepID=A0A9Q2Z0G9_RHOHA|nr:Hsp70 family protein [Prescottella equi]MBM4502293.1 Hsp70 family protein [Prescottella equi]MBM4506145.1 Hsp70 family protein [Prescottella equi]MBM4512701.1 Hsp70 family protein [Prescottella equi]MBM4550346.1 Hsp70 family protein [Prescottella equi]